MKLLTRKVVAQVMECVLHDFETRRATKFVSENYVVKATRQFKPQRSDRSWTVILTFGQPNFREREFIRSCVKAEEPFPIKRVQLKFYPK